jgi:glycolate oxidase FAD binding subunit
VRGDGLVAKAGGKVVKNVSGFEIARLLHGSWGSLAVITSANLKTIPLHEFGLTLQSEPTDTAGAAERVLTLTRARSAIAAAVVDGTADSGTVSVRLTGRQGPTLELAREIRETAGIQWATETQQSADWWQKRENRLATNAPGRVAIEIGCQPADVVRVLRTLHVAMPAAEDVDVHVSPGSGAIQIALDEAAISLGAWQRIWAEHGLDRTARWTVTTAPREWRAERDVWSIPPGPRQIMQSLKNAFDPNHTLNRGRLWTSPVATAT